MLRKHAEIKFIQTRASCNGSEVISLPSGVSVTEKPLWMSYLSPLLSHLVVPVRQLRQRVSRPFSHRIWPESKNKKIGSLILSRLPKMCYFVWGFIRSRGSKFQSENRIFRHISTPMLEIDLNIGGTGVLSEKSHRNSSDPGWFRGVVSSERVLTVG